MSNNLLIQNLKQMIENIETNPIHFDKPLLNRAFAQEVACAVSFEDEETGSRIYSALVKAMTNIETNKTIQFKAGILFFVSQNSGKTRIVTEFGCSRECDCSSKASYHQASYAIVARYFALLEKQEATRQPVYANDHNAPYLRPSSLKKPEIVGGVRI